jgi:hypothetical protein
MILNSLSLIFSEHVFCILELILNVVELSLGSIGSLLSLELAGFLLLSELGDLFLTTAAQFSLREENFNKKFSK